MLTFDKVLRRGERVRKSAGVSNISLVVSLIAIAVAVVAYWAGMQHMLSLGGDSELSSVIMPLSKMVMNVLTAILALVCAWELLLLVLKSLFTSYGLTDSRVLQRSFLRTRAADLIHVQDVEVSQGLLGKLLDYGDVRVKTASTDGTLVLRRVDKPHDWFPQISGNRG